MLDHASPDRHQAEISMDSGLHTIEGALIYRPMDRALDSRRAFRLQRAGRAGRRAVADRPITSMDSRWAQCLPARATDRVAVLVVEELDRSKMFGIHRAALDRRCDVDVLALATGDFLGVRRQGKSCRSAIDHLTLSKALQQIFHQAGIVWQLNRSVAMPKYLFFMLAGIATALWIVVSIYWIWLEIIQQSGRASYANLASAMLFVAVCFLLAGTVQAARLWWTSNRR